ncbi:MAG TPA: hypothetical protein VNU97_09285 [Rhizomicrobium sp.]|jgi:hypothetical protein|nr:hypothetical protein [Rhizomicrobium sp.]
MHGLAPFIAPALALFLILRRGMRPTRIKPDRLWIYPGIITLLALAALSRGKLPGLEGIAIFVAAVLGGGALGWFTTQHVELTLDDKTGTIMSQPTPFGTLLTGAVFAARFILEYLVNGGPGGGAPAALKHGDLYVWLADAGLLFVAARGLTRAWHMWARTRPLLAQHKAAQLPPQ